MKIVVSRSPRLCQTSPALCAETIISAHAVQEKKCLYHSSCPLRRSVISTEAERRGETPALPFFHHLATPHRARPFALLVVAFAVMLSATIPSRSEAQFAIEDSHTTASLRGIHNVGGGIAWASGTDGTVLRTLNDGKTWQTCPVPLAGTKDTAEKLDFRGIQAFDENTAIVMSSGPGDQSRLYKTTDGCQTWKLLFTNPDSTGFFDAIQISLDPASWRSDGKRTYTGQVIGDPVNGKFVEFDTRDSQHWIRNDGGEAGMPSARDGEALFAASNSGLLLSLGGELFVTGGVSGSRSRILSEYVKHEPRVSWKYTGGDIPIARGESAGTFSVATSADLNQLSRVPAEKDFTVFYFHRDAVCVSVGGDYKKPDELKQTAAFSMDGGQHWKAAQTPPHGYRSAVAYDAPTKTWITVGPNGTDISTDDGRNWRPLTPTPSDAPDADKNWNALSLPFVVGPHGRIGKLRTTALPQPMAIMPTKSKR
jgi:hypothetical protein